MARTSALQSLFALAAASPAIAAGLDYVIVGGGPAGFVVAEQLSRNPDVGVTVLEAGPDGSDEDTVNVPAIFYQTMPLLWDYYSEPEEILGGATPNLWQGKVLGGGTAVNAMVYTRGAASVYDEWAEISGNDGLAWASILDDFRAVSHYTEQPADYELTVDTSVYGDGPLEVTGTSALTGFDQPFTSALQAQLGLEETDFNDGHGVGYAYALQSVRVSNRTRSYAYNTFGYLSATRPNVQILNNAWVQKIGFSDQKAQDVTYTDTLTNETHTINAEEVIVAAGAVKSPQLLLLSGIGPADQLEALDIPVVADIPEVGTNLYDHHNAAIQVQVTDDIETIFTWYQNETALAIAQEQYEADGSGPLGRTNGASLAGTRLPDQVFIDVDNTYYPSLPEDRPQILYTYVGVPLLPDGPSVNAVTAWASVVQPEASGYLTLQSSDYRDAPLIYSNYYGSDGDRAAIEYAFNELREIFRSDELADVVVGEIFPGEHVTSDEDVWAAIQQISHSYHHPVGTVALGTVLDSDWRVKGLQGIRVVDSSAMPTLPTCPIQAVVYAFAHRAALDIIEADGIGV
ncbi:hypothetical protein FQN54_006397 [Arachnomyces sp. PD_36]|nr:hypothetical protein FQN54_006397 [Arachnomyces sp. PD_36]